MKRILITIVLPALLIAASADAQITRLTLRSKYDPGINIIQLQAPLISDVTCLFRTQTQGGWGSPAHGNNPGRYLTSNFALAFPSGLTVGCSSGFTLTLQTSLAVTDFLPSGGQPSALTSNLTDPIGYKNTLAGQVTALALSAGFDAVDPNFGASSSSLASQTIASGTFAGWSVQQVLDEGNAVLGGCSTAHTPAEMTDILGAINESFDDGVAYNSNLFTCSCEDLYLLFIADTVCLGATTVITNLSSGVDSNAVYSLDIFNDGTVDFTSIASALPHDTMIAFPFADTINYSVTVVNSNGCSAAFTGSILVLPADSVCLNNWGEKKEANNSRQTETRFNILPNPSTDQTTISFSVAHETAALIEVFSMDGKKVATLFDGKVKDSVTNNIKFQSANYQSGIYLCRMKTNNGINLVNKMIVME